MIKQQKREQQQQQDEQEQQQNRDKQDEGDCCKVGKRQTKEGCRITQLISGTNNKTSNKYTKLFRM